MAQKVVGLTQTIAAAEPSLGNLLYRRGDHPPRWDLIAGGFAGPPARML
jgi:hypothetical protein